MGGTFRVVWLRRFDLPFGATEHLTNPLNEGKPVKICRDGQELPPDVGEALVALIEDGADAAGVPRPSRPAGAALACGPCGTIGVNLFRTSPRFTRMFCAFCRTTALHVYRMLIRHCRMTEPDALAALTWDW